MYSAICWRCSGVSTRLISSIDFVMRLLAASCIANSFWRSASSALSSTVGCANSASASWRSARPASRWLRISAVPACMICWICARCSGVALTRSSSRCSMPWNMPPPP